jgi:Ca2+-binding RTX toxin-like protein
LNTITGKDGDDALTGTPGPDTIEGLGGNDVIIAGDGEDWLYGGTGDDRMEGGAGYDRYFVDSPGDMVIEAIGGGFDDVLTSTDYTLAPGSEVELLRSVSGTAPIVLAGNEFQNHLIGNAGANRLDGGTAEDILEGLDGDDELHGGDGTDGLWGGMGDDRLFGDQSNDGLEGGNGADWLDGGDGEDSANYSEASGPVIVDLHLSEQDTRGAGIDTLINIEEVGGSEFADRLTGNDLANVLSGWGGDDFVDAGEGADRLYGHDGDDILLPGLGVDQVTGGAGSDTFRGLAAELSGDSIFDFSRGDRIVINDATLAGFTYQLSEGTLTFSGGYIFLNNTNFASIAASVAPEGGVQITFAGPPIVVSGGNSVQLATNTSVAFQYAELADETPPAHQTFPQPADHRSSSHTFAEGNYWEAPPPSQIDLIALS